MQEESGKLGITICSSHPRGTVEHDRIYCCNSHLLHVVLHCLPQLKLIKLFTSCVKQVYQTLFEALSVCDLLLVWVTDLWYKYNW